MAVQVRRADIFKLRLYPSCVGCADLDNSSASWGIGIRAFFSTKIGVGGDGFVSDRGFVGRRPRRCIRR